MKHMKGVIVEGNLHDTTGVVFPSKGLYTEMKDDGTRQRVKD